MDMDDDDDIASHTTPSTFPTEVYERVIDFLPHFGKPRLATCCLVSRSWFPRCRFHLYFEISIGSAKSYDAFLRCLEINPRNSDYVKMLLIFPSPDMEWYSTVLFTLASKLKNLSTLTLFNFGVTDPSSSIFQHLSTFSTVTELRIDNGMFRRLPLVQTISAFPLLRKLSSRTFLPYPQQDPTITLALTHWKDPLPLRHITLDQTSTPTILPALVASATPLTALHFEQTDSDVDGQTLECVGSFLSSCHTLRVVRLNVYDVSARVVCPLLSLSSLPDLHHFTLDIAIEKLKDIYALAHLLSDISAHSLQFLQLNLNLKYDPDILRNPTPWKMLNSAILSPNVHTTREFAIFMQTSDYAQVTDEFVFRLLPALRNMKVVDCWYQDRYEAFWDKL